VRNSKDKGLRFVRSAGDDLLSVSVADPQTAQRLSADLRDSGDWIEAVAGVDSVVVRFDIASVSRADAENRLSNAAANISEPTEELQVIVEIPVVYGGESGPDFDYVCEELGLSGQAFIEMHCGEYTVDMLGFTPGFAYIGGLDERLVIDRLEHPRQYIPAGSVGIAGGRTGLYSLPGPGGWPLIGRTDRQLFDAAADEPFALVAGATVIFTAVDDS
jgi:KipI family sensor histidine kinase inhibitor